eukprot:TRINITY_DN5682_c0_g1_i2.p1 TRINITY_DN5682_c0_g1~~TRINITY_DN5682_c0_g1_i2.p1  ORF type:complete len:354 (+),score=62.88 TRINITY_DN5682_c0_g1_i2:746-1807(+)
MMPAYFIALDHERQSVVLAVRGTMSLTDTLTDVCASIGPFLDGYGHVGIVHGAEALVEDTQPIIDKAMIDFPTYQLIITGHSLGAAVSALVATLLRPKYPTVHAFAFAPPPCMSSALAHLSENYVTSFVVQYDIIPRLSLKSIYELGKRGRTYAQESRARSLREAKEGIKHMVSDVKNAVKGAWSSIFGKKEAPKPQPYQDLPPGGYGEPLPQELVQVVDTVPLGTAIPAEEPELPSFEKLHARDCEILACHAELSPRSRAIQPLHIPGRIFQLWNVMDIHQQFIPAASRFQPPTGHPPLATDPRKARSYVMFPTSGEELSHIKLAWTLLNDHMPSSYDSALRNVTKHLCNEP